MSYPICFHSQIKIHHKMSKFNREFFSLLASNSQHAVLVLAASLAREKDVESLIEFVSVLKDEMKDHPSVTNNRPFHTIYPGELGARSVMLHDVFCDALATSKEDNLWTASQEKLYEEASPFISINDTVRLQFIGDAPDKIYDPRCMSLLNKNEEDDLNYAGVIFSRAVKSGNIPVMREMFSGSSAEIIESCIDGMLLDRKFINVNKSRTEGDVSSIFQGSSDGRREVIDLMNEFQSDNMNHMRVAILFDQFDLWSKKGQSWDEDSICEVMGVDKMEDAKQRISTCLRGWDYESRGCNVDYAPKGINIENENIKQLLGAALNNHCLPVLETLKHLVVNAVDDQDNKVNPLAAVMAGNMANKDQFKEVVGFLVDKGYPLSLEGPKDENKTSAATVALAKAEEIPDKSEKLFALLEMGADVSLRSSKFKKASSYCQKEEKDQWDGVVSAYNARNAAMDVMALLADISPKSSPKI